MDYSLKEINKILYGNVIGPCERKRRRKIRRLRSKSSSLSGRSRVPRRTSHRRSRLLAGCCQLRHPSSNTHGTIAGSMCLSFPGHRSRMRRSTVAPVTTSTGVAAGRAVAGRTTGRVTGPAAAAGRAARGSGARGSGVRTSGARGRGAQTRPVRRAEPVRGSLTVRQRTRADRQRVQRLRQQKQRVAQEGVKRLVDQAVSISEREEDEDDMKSAATGKSSTTAGNMLSPPPTGTSRTSTGSGAAGDPASLEARIAAFKSDPVLMEVASRFVSEVLERAKEEASKRLRERDGAVPPESRFSSVAVFAVEKDFQILQSEKPEVKIV